MAKRRVTPNDILMWVAIRKTLKTMGSLFARLHNHERVRMLDLLKLELQELYPDKVQASGVPRIWMQAVADVEGVERYALERDGYLRENDENRDADQV